MKKVLLAFVVACFFFFLMFSEYTKSYVNFWLTMAVTAGTLTLLGWWFGKGWKGQCEVSAKNILLGVCMAAGLYAVFFVGNRVSNLLFDFAANQISGIYDIKKQANPWLIGLALVCLIGPAEELFWRGYLQRTFEQKYGEWMAFGLSVFCYTFVHVCSLNFMLIMAALVCGTFWGFMYMKTKNLVPLIISHALWDLSIFILFPVA